MSDRHASSSSAASASHSRRGQSLVEFALVLPLLLLLFGGIVQLGTVIATNHTLIQIGRDVGRWAATQNVNPCQNLAAQAQPVTRAHQIAVESRLMGYDGAWTSNFKSWGVGPMPAAAPTAPGVEVAWQIDSGTCPPTDATTASFVTVRLAHAAPVLLPGFGYLPPLGTNGQLLITTTAQFRMEPQAAPAQSTP